MKNSLVGIIIPTYNSARYIIGAIESALAQTYRPIEIIIVDDGSTDNTTQIIEEYAKSQNHKITKSQVNIRYFYQENRGPAAARNKGIKEANGEYIAFLDADDIWLPEKLGKQINLFKKDRSIGLVHSRCLGFRNSIDELLPKKIVNNGENWGYIFPKLFLRNYIAASSVIAKEECFQNLGLFDESEGFISVEDYDMWLRISKKYKVGYVNETLAGYKVHAKGISKQIDRFYLNQKNVIKKVIDNCPDVERLTSVDIRWRFSKLYSDYGLDLLTRECLQEAREKFLVSFKCYPRNVNSLINYFKCLLPTKLFKTFRYMKTKLLNKDKKREDSL